MSRQGIGKGLLHEEVLVGGAHVLCHPPLTLPNLMMNASGGVSGDCKCTASPPFNPPLPNPKGNTWGGVGGGCTCAVSPPLPPYTHTHTHASPTLTSTLSSTSHSNRKVELPTLDSSHPAALTSYHYTTNFPIVAILAIV